MFICKHGIIQDVVLCFRGAVESIRAIADATTAETFSTEVVQRLMAACDTLRVSAAVFTKMNCGQQTAEAHRDCAFGLRLLGSKVTDIEEKHRYLLDGLSHMQLAVALQEHVVLRDQRLFAPQEVNKVCSFRIQLSR
ncbi:hypothetical protein ILYODFUR_038339 [Ilyodon furcidens]|uniref:Uncharacterized protein n=1 Tax=Ilyodon furcidens TaxID=33524 RepID=A0ABV0UPT8_9TELE